MTVVVLEAEHTMIWATSGSLSRRDFSSICRQSQQAKVQRATRMGSRGRGRLASLWP